MAWTGAPPLSAGERAPVDDAQPPLGAGEPLSVDDPDLPLRVLVTGR
jgi:hypothetical protein